MGSRMAKAKTKYDKHPSPQLNQAYQGYQGQKPNLARMEFLNSYVNRHGRLTLF